MTKNSQARVRSGNRFSNLNTKTRNISIFVLICLEMIVAYIYYIYYVKIFGVKTRRTKVEE